MDIEDKQTIAEQIKVSSFFVVAALSPSFLISLICVLLYLVTAFPEIKKPLTAFLTDLLSGLRTNNVATTSKDK